jgi:hypothetical protein
MSLRYLPGIAFLVAFALYSFMCSGSSEEVQLATPLIFALAKRLLASRGRRGSGSSKPPADPLTKLNETYGRKFAEQGFIPQRKPAKPLGERYEDGAMSVFNKTPGSQ